MEDDILTIEEVAKYIKISERTVYEWAQKGDIPAGKLGNVWRFKKTEIEQWVNDKLKNNKSTDNIISDIKHLLAPERVLISNFSTKRDILTSLIENISTAPQIKDSKKLEAGIWEREKLMSTGIGLGIGIPHIRSSAVKDIVVSVAINKIDIIDYQALDNKAVRIVFMVAAAQNQHAEYLKLLASIGNLLQNETFMNKLLLEDDSMGIYKLLTEGE
jgi:PTS system nitrogen regulatory IIA component